MNEQEWCGNVKRRFRFSLTTLLVLVLLAALVTRFWIPKREMPIEPPVANPSVKQVTDVLAAACKAEFAIVFVQLDWTFLHREREFFQEFATQYYRSQPLWQAKFHIINFTPVSDGYQPLAALPGWDEYDPGPNSHQINGCGEIIWLKKGRIVGIGRLDKIEDVEEAIDMTNRYFS